MHISFRLPSATVQRAWWMIDSPAMRIQPLKIPVVAMEPNVNPSNVSGSLGSLPQLPAPLFNQVAARPRFILLCDAYYLDFHSDTGYSNEQGAPIFSGGPTLSKRYSWYHHWCIHVARRRASATLTGWSPTAWLADVYATNAPNAPFGFNVAQQQAWVANNQLAIDDEHEPLSSDEYESDNEGDVGEEYGE
ncbi:hypothetical protein BU23DRAFT_568677 [Bimuria novae-zelandiae CBS 107.79]|uniref:Uncharacterized protein n=1 Tax=Bimuria novae-zelandiae CBS 107.79 TaxID=1447943 RepID=A0A6A5VCT6_9PLEO|nr:hypothetical protein BU23DRAFT_568677 [Bimuria novae-zelandiae CBS 107.79]